MLTNVPELSASYAPPTSRTHRAPIANPSQTQLLPMRAYLSPIDYTSIQHEITKLSLHSLLPFSFIFEIKEENYHHTTSYHIAHTSRTHRKPNSYPSRTHRKPIANPSRTHRAPIANPTPTHRAHIANPSRTHRAPIANPSQTQLLPMRPPHRAPIARLFITY
jgi:hypothetical protein